MGPQRKPDRLIAFDGLRAWAALSVLGYHVALASGDTRHGSLGAVLSVLKGGVAIFFVISGFLLYLPYARALGKGTQLPNWRDYAHRRALRILPGYWVALTILALSPLSPDVAAPGWWRFYGLSQIYDRTTLMGGLGVAWSLCVEVSFYVMLPLIACAVAQLPASVRRLAPYRSQAIVLIALGVSSVSLRVLLATSLTAEVRSSGLLVATSLLGFLDWFAAGMGLALMLTVHEAGGARLHFLRRFFAFPSLCWLGATALFLGVAAIDAGDPFLPVYGVVPHLLIGCGAALIVAPAAFADSNSRLTRTLASPIGVWLGTVSYGIFLWHLPVIEAVNGPIPARPPTLSPVHVLALLVLTLAGGILLGALSWYLVERPATRLLGRRRTADRAPAPAQAISTR